MKYKTRPLSELCSLTNGYAFKSSDFCDSGIPVIKIANVKPNRILSDNLQCVPFEKLESANRAVVKKGDILLTMTGNRFEGTPDSWVGKTARFDLDGLYLLNQRLCIVRPSDEIDPVYLAYALSSWDSQLYFVKHATSSGGQANISPKIVNDFKIPYPPLEDQVRIASLLRTLDDKIRLNTQINKNLLEQAQAIYSDMFIANTNPAWQNGHLSDLITVRYGKDHKKLADGSIPVYGSGGIMRYVERPLYDKESVLIPRKGTLNNVIYVNEPFGRAC